MARHWAFPMRLGPDGHPVTVEQDSPDHVADQIHLALLTRVGDGTPLRPSFGTVGLAFLEQPLDTEALAAELRELIPGAEVQAEQLPLLIDTALARINVYVGGGD